MKLKRSDIIDTLLTEPSLTPGHFFNKYDGECSVCAVGAIVRKAFDTKSLDITPFCYYLVKGCWSQHDNIQKALEEENYLGALSAYFEKESSCGEDADAPIFRKKLVEYVEKYFPETIEIADYKKWKKTKDE